MNCPKCKSRSIITDSRRRKLTARGLDPQLVQKRRRVCPECRITWRTVEITVDHFAQLVKSTDRLNLLKKQLL